MNGVFDQPVSAFFAFERQAFFLLFSTIDKQEGVAAFLAKRKPEWKAG